MTQLLNRTGVAMFYGYGTDPRTVILRDDDNTVWDLYDLALDRRREEVIEDWQNWNSIRWDMLTVCAQDDRLRAVEELVANAVEADRPFARTEAESIALDGLIPFSDLTERAQQEVDGEVRARWDADSYAA